MEPNEAEPRGFSSRYPKLADGLVACGFLAVRAVIIAIVLLALSDQVRHHGLPSAEMPGTVQIAVTWGVVLVEALVLWVWRRTHTLWLFAATQVCLVVLETFVPNDDLRLGESLATMIALFAVSQWASIRSAWVCTAIAVVVNGLFVFSQAGLRIDSLVVFGFGGVAFAAITIVGAYFKQRLDYEESLVERNRLLGVDQELAISEERAVIARELHDIVAHSLSVMVTLAEGAHLQFEKNPVAADRAVQQVAATGREAIGDMRRVLSVLRGETDADLALSPQPSSMDLDSLIETFRQAGLPVEVRFTRDDLPMEPLPTDAGLGLTIYRLIQEALTNVLRYAPDSIKVVVSVYLKDGLVHVGIANRLPEDAAPVRDWNSSGHGLVGMAERVKLFGGTLVAGPTDYGWNVHATLNPNKRSHDD